MTATDFHEITKRLHQSEVRLRLLSDSAMTLMSQPDPYSISADLFLKAMKALNCEVYFHYTLDSASQKLILYSAGGVSDQERAQLHSFDMTDSVCGDVSVCRQPEMLSDLQSDDDPRFQILRRLGLKSYCCLPLVSSGSLLGTLGFGSKVHAQQTPSDLEVMRAFADQVAIAFERESRNQEIIKAKVAAESSSRLKTAFLAMMSHELRTPLGAILGFAQLLKEGRLIPEEKAHCIDIILRNGEHLQSIIDDVLDLTKVESGYLSIERLRFNVHDLVNDVVELLRIQAQQKELNLVVIWTGNRDLVIESDPVRFRQILMNLIGNAIKFTSIGSVQIQVSTHPSGNGKTNLAIDVIDTGIGLTSEQAERLFKPFTQANESIVRKYGGTGLGLVLSKRLANALGGELTLERSVFGQGSVFRFALHDLNLNEIRNSFPAPSAAVCELRPATADSAPQSLTGLKLLLVEDSIDNQNLISRLLKKKGAEVEIADNGERAIEMIHFHEFDMILMDVQMPVMDGLTATYLIREMGYARPIIAITAHALSEVQTNCMRVGCSDYLIKPISPRALYDAIERNLPTATRVRCALPN